MNTSILNGWFWSPRKRTRSAARLVDYFYTSVGRNGNMLLNLAPDTRGLIPDDQLAALGRMFEVVDATLPATSPPAPASPPTAPTRATARPSPAMAISAPGGRPLPGTRARPSP